MNDIKRIEAKIAAEVERIRAWNDDQLNHESGMKGHPLWPSTMKKVTLFRILTTIPTSKGGPGHPRTYYEAKCGCLFRSLPHTGKGEWHPCLLHALQEAQCERLMEALRRIVQDDDDLYGCGHQTVAKAALQAEEQP